MNLDNNAPDYIDPLDPALDEVDEADTWPDEPLPLTAKLEEPKPFPMKALPSVLAKFGEVLRRTTQAPDAIIGGSILAAASLAAQAHANIRMPHGRLSPISLAMLSIAESGERKSAVDRLVLHAHALFEKRKKDEYELAMAAVKALPKDQQVDTKVPKQPIFMTGDPTIEGIVKLLTNGMPSLGVFSAEGGRFIGGYGMSDESSLRTAAGLSNLWDGDPIDRVRSGDGAAKMYHRRVAFHLMVQPRAAFTWLSNPVLRDQGLFSRVLAAFPSSTAGTRLFRDERADETPEFEAYVTAMSALLDAEWPTNEYGELEPIEMTFSDEARALWIQAHDHVETEIKGTLAPVRALASKSAEHLARIAAVLELVRNPDATEVSAQALTKALEILQWYLDEAVRLAGAQPVKEGTERAQILWDWLAQRGKKYICPAEIMQFGPAKVRQAKVLRETMGVLAEHHLVRTFAGTIEWSGRKRREGWEVRL